MKNYKVLWVVLCKNEMEILPFCQQYWSRIADKVVVYDNGSVDGSIEYLKTLPYVELRHFDSDGQHEGIQKEIKEKAYLEFKDQFDIIILSDCDELFFMSDMESTISDFCSGAYDILAFPLFALCEDHKPNFEADLLLHQQCHKFYKQRLNHMDGFSELSKLSIFNCHTVDSVSMSVGQHYVQTNPSMRIMLSYDGFCLHVDKGFGVVWKYKVRRKMNENLSEFNKSHKMCIEYAYDYDTLRNEYLNNQRKSFDINKKTGEKFLF